MATEGQRAPRVAPGSDSMAARFAAAQEAGAPIRADEPEGEARLILAEVTSILELLCAGYDDAAQAKPNGQGEMLLRSGEIYARAFEGIRRLVNLADFHVAVSMGDRP